MKNVKCKVKNVSGDVPVIETVRPPNSPNLSLNTVDHLGMRSTGVRPWNIRPLYRQRQPTIKPFIGVKTDGAAVPSDASLANAIATTLAMSFRFKYAVEMKGHSMCNQQSRIKRTFQDGFVAMRACTFKCCVITYLRWDFADEQLYYLESAVLYNKKCDEVQRMGFIENNPAPYIRMRKFESFNN